MGLLPGDLERVPNDLSMRHCYERIYTWHHRRGLERFKERYGEEDSYAQSYRALLNQLPEASSASRADMACVFNEVITNRLEWAYHEQDEQGIKTAAYAHFAVDKWFDRELAKLQGEAQQSPLYPRR